MFIGIEADSHAMRGFKEILSTRWHFLLQITNSGFSKRGGGNLQDVCDEIFNVREEFIG